MVEAKTGTSQDSLLTSREKFSLGVDFLLYVGKFLRGSQFQQIDKKVSIVNCFLAYPRQLLSY